MDFTPRMTAPEAGNRYYNTPAAGGVNPSIEGNPKNAGCNVLPNCVGYAVGRWLEIGKWTSLRCISPVNAERFIQASSGAKVGQTPKPGAIMVWQKGDTLDGSDGAGHVAVVERVVSDTVAITSESGWGGPFFTVKTRGRADGNWGQSGAYRFLGFLYHPDLEAGETAAPPATAPVSKLTQLPILRFGARGETVKALQILLKGRGYDPGEIDGIFGHGTWQALNAAQQHYTLTVDGEAGPATWGALLGATN